MSLQAYDKGDLVRFSATFKNLSDALADPTTVTFRVKRPDGAITVWIVTAGQVVRDSLGLFHADVPIDQSGDWSARWEGAGALVAAEEFTFIGRASAF